MPRHRARKIHHQGPGHRAQTGMEIKPHVAVADRERLPFRQVGPAAAGGEVREEGGVEVGEVSAGGGVGEDGGEGLEELVPVGAEGGMRD